MLHKPKHYNQKQSVHEFCRHTEVKLAEQGARLAHNAATKGSTCTHDDSMHMQLPGTIKFVNNPKKEGVARAHVPLTLAL